MIHEVTSHCHKERKAAENGRNSGDEDPILELELIRCKENDPWEKADKFLKEYEQPFVAADLLDISQAILVINLIGCYIINNI